MSRRLEIIVGSVREGRLGPSVASWFDGVAREHGGFDVGLLDLAEWDLPLDLSGSDVTTRFAARVGAADAFVVVTPEYNHGYPAALKNALDSMKYEWRGKPIGFVSYGGMSGGLRAVEGLRLVAAELHMVSVRDAVSFHRAKKTFGRGGPVDTAAVDSASRMLDQLVWWSARVTEPGEQYPN